MTAASVTGRGGALGVDDRQPILKAELPCLAERRQRANQAARLARRADQSSQIHERLVEGTGIFGRHQARGCLPEAFSGGCDLDILTHGEQTRQHALAVRLDDRLRPIHRKREDRAGDVAADARQSPDRRRDRRASRLRGRARSFAPAA